MSTAKAKGNSVEAIMAKVQATSGGAGIQGRLNSKPYLLNLKKEQIVFDDNQVRFWFDEDEIAALRLSIEENGQLEPIVAYPVPNEKNRFKILVGERRVRAILSSKKIETIAAMIMAVDDNDKVSIALKQYAENHVRVNLSAIETAVFYKKMVELQPEKLKKDIADQLGIAPSDLSRSLGILDIPKNIQESALKFKMADVHAVVALNELYKLDPNCLKLAEQQFEQEGIVSRTWLKSEIRTLKAMENPKAVENKSEISKSEGQADLAASKKDSQENNSTDALTSNQLKNDNPIEAAGHDRGSSNDPAIPVKKTVETGLNENRPIAGTVDPTAKTNPAQGNSPTLLSPALGYDEELINLFISHIGASSSESVISLFKKLNLSNEQYVILKDWANNK